MGVLLSGWKKSIFYGIMASQSVMLSENEEILAAIDQVGEAVQNRGIWIIDRGADRDAIFEPLLNKRRDFIIRMVGTRDLINQGKVARSLWLAYACRLPYQKSIVKIIDGKEVVYDLSFGHVKVRLPDMDTPLNMVVARGTGSKPMMLLTTLDIGNRQEDVWLCTIINPGYHFQENRKSHICEFFQLCDFHLYELLLRYHCTRLETSTIQASGNG
jgi:hypothetical protein